MITKTTISGLAQPERDELLAILREARGRAFGTARFQPEKDALAGYLIFGVAGIAGAIAYLAVFGAASLPSFWSGLPSSVTYNPAALGFHAAIVVGPLCAWRFATRFYKVGH